MAFKDVIALVIATERDEAALAAAERMGAAHDAHITAALLTPLPDEPLAYEPTVVAGIWAELLGRARHEADAERKRLEARLARVGRPFGIEQVEALARDLGRVGAVHARYHQVAVIAGPRAGDEARDQTEELIEGVLHHSGRPALVVPPAWGDRPIGTRILVAWDASREATRALAEATPLLAAAQAVAVVTVDAKPKAFGHGERPGANIAGHLARLGVSVEVRNIDGLGRPVSDALAAEASAFGADLIVMGAYAHSRLRDLVFGGATRDFLANVPVPLLLAH